MLSFYLVEPGISVKRVTVDPQSKIETLNTITKLKSNYVYNGSLMPVMLSFKDMGIKEGSMLMCLNSNSSPKRNFDYNSETIDIDILEAKSMNPEIAREKARLLDLRQTHIDNNPKKFRLFLKLQDKSPKPCFRSNISTVMPVPSLPTPSSEPIPLSW